MSADLPLPFGHLHSDGDFHSEREAEPPVWWPVSLYTADQMLAFRSEALAAQAAEVERLIAAVDEYRAHIITMGREKDAQIAAQAAEALRKAFGEIEWEARDALLTNSKDRADWIDDMRDIAGHVAAARAALKEQT